VFSKHLPQAGLSCQEGPAGHASAGSTQGVAGKWLLERIDGAARRQTSTPRTAVCWAGTMPNGADRLVTAWSVTARACWRRSEVGPNRHGGGKTPLGRSSYGMTVDRSKPPRYDRHWLARRWPDRL